ncbi:geranylgeranylglycerol-phosphate geranylgeranyltransferase [Fulvivirga sp.]|uniref:geranylgeranylglycerol-phosphate geranylgeranyltransferase n=1 Tax=Fulvivirga sp. TaxID=1931237 RepID=UPI0032F07F71
MVSETHSKPTNFSISGFIQLTRFWNLLIIALAQYFTAYFLLSNSSLVFSKEMALLSFSTIIIAAAGYIINDYYDVKIDLINKPKRVVVGRILKRRVAMIAHTVLNFIGIGIGLHLSWKLGALNFLCAFVLWLYSNQLKRIAFLGNLSVALLTGLSILIIGLFFEPDNILIMAYSLFAFAFTLIREIIKDIEDLKGDSTFGCKTLPVVYGVRKTKSIIYILSYLFLIGLCTLAYLIVGLAMTYLCLGLIIPIGYLTFKLYRADKISEYNFLSNYCKFVMLFGICTMVFF